MNKKEAFMKANPLYGYNQKIDDIRTKNFPHMKGAAYLDHSGTTIYSSSTVKKFAENLSKNLYGNPHSNSPSSVLSTLQVDQARERILQLFNADSNEWDVIFTANATAAIKIVADSFPWKEGSEFVYLKENHTSAVGVRASVKNIPGTTTRPISRKDLEKSLSHSSDSTRPQSFLYPAQSNFNGSKFPLEWESAPYGNFRALFAAASHLFKSSSEASLPEALSGDIERPPSLFVYPAQSNFNGTRFPLEWIPRLRKSADYSHFRILLDAASYMSSSRLDLSNISSAPDFIAISLYKIFGYPTGLGALLVRRVAAPDLIKNGYFGGGTVRVTSVHQDEEWQKFRYELHERFEDGTINFLSIVALNIAMDEWDRLFGNPVNMSNHVSSLTAALYQEMNSMKHWNGNPLCVFYCEDLKAVGDAKKQGPIVTFNLKDSNGRWRDFNEVDKIASKRGIHLRTGTFCNPGAASHYLDLTTKNLQHFVDENILCSDFCLVDGHPNGAIRVSLGAMSTYEDISELLTFLKENFLESKPVIDEVKKGRGSLWKTISEYCWDGCAKFGYWYL